MPPPLESGLGRYVSPSRLSLAPHGSGLGRRCPSHLRPALADPGANTAHEVERQAMDVEILCKVDSDDGG